MVVPFLPNTRSTSWCTATVAVAIKAMTFTVSWTKLRNSPTFKRAFLKLSPLWANVKLMILAHVHSKHKLPFLIVRASSIIRARNLQLYVVVVSNGRHCWFKIKISEVNKTIWYWPSRTLHLTSGLSCSPVTCATLIPLVQRFLTYIYSTGVA